MNKRIFLFSCWRAFNRYKAMQGDCNSGGSRATLVFLYFCANVFMASGVFLLLLYWNLGHKIIVLYAIYRIRANLKKRVTVISANMPPPLFLGQFSQKKLVGVLSFLGGGRGCAGTLTRPSTRHLLPKNFEKTGLKKGGHICGKN